MHVYTVQLLQGSGWGVALTSLRRYNSDNTEDRLTSYTVHVYSAHIMSLFCFRVPLAPLRCSWRVLFQIIG